MKEFVYFISGVLAGVMFLVLIFVLFSHVVPLMLNVRTTDLATEDFRAIHDSEIVDGELACIRAVEAKIDHVRYRWTSLTPFKVRTRTSESGLRLWGSDLEVEMLDGTFSRHIYSCRFDLDGKDIFLDLLRAKI